MQKVHDFVSLRVFIRQAKSNIYIDTANKFYSKNNRLWLKKAFLKIVRYKILDWIEWVVAFLSEICKSPWKKIYIYHRSVEKNPTVLETFMINELEELNTS